MRNLCSFYGKILQVLIVSKGRDVNLLKGVIVTMNKRGRRGNFRRTFVPFFFGMSVLLHRGHFFASLIFPFTWDKCAEEKG